jgi:hypothetical protein
LEERAASAAESGELGEIFAQAKAGVEAAASSRPARKWPPQKWPPHGEPVARSGPDLARERITESTIRGELVEWKGSFGWITVLPDSAPEVAKHPKYSKHSGRIYVHRQDLPGGLKEMAIGAGVQFHVYADTCGLGAEEIQLL